MKFSPGNPVARREDDRLLTGRGRYAGDVRLPGQAHAAVVRSDYGHARILSVDPSAALEMPGVLAVLTAREMAEDGIGGMRFRGHLLSGPLCDRAGREFVNPPRMPLASERVRYVGEPVAVVVADTPARAVDAAEAVLVECDELPAVADIAAAIAEGAPLVRDDCPGNEVFLYRAGDAEATERAFATAPHRLSRRLTVNRVHANPMEPRSFTGDYDAARDHFTVHAGVHRPFECRNALADHVFGIPRERVDVVPGDIGGSFGLKGSIPPEVALVAWASKRVGRPVTWTATRSEMLTADDHGRDMIADAEIAFDDEGRLLAFRTRNINNIGAYMSTNGAAPATNNLGSLAGTYTIPHMAVEVSGVWTNTTPTSPYRGSGRPEAAYAIERMIDLAARELGMDPVEIRRRNLIPNDAFPYDTPLEFVYDCGEFDKVLEKAVAAADYAGFPSRRAEAAARGRLRGIGVAMAIEIATRPGTEYVSLRFAADGGVTVLAGTTNHGQGHETLFAQYLSDRLGIDPARVRVVESDTREVAAGNGTGGSRSAAFGAGAIMDGIDKSIAAGRPIAAHLLQAAEAEIGFDDGVYRVGGAGRGVSFLEVAKASFDEDMRPAGLAQGLQADGVLRLDAPNFPNGCQVCEVEIDPDTGVVEIVAHTVCDDVGFELNPQIVKGQIQGGVLQGLGQVLMENMVFSEEGQNMTGSFMDYAMPRATDSVSPVVLSHPVPTTTNPAGVKGVGESGRVGALPAAMNAIADALAPLGIDHIDMPATPGRVWEAIRAARGAARSRSA
ncbi:xanthine dehydrogenase family protein molybdopterin-binding subunit [Celeribacter indicus]|uniref:Carbon monoxide dehydrogenase n=1 Tax=Celeribacter indicus TaxID=1208324 RepID=A0A0B5E084_9RHOB|nr:xanthine dehydrogenase family protein molybdopterin-binding subunit [Celeribacter indicus]AJE46810.1 carbon monoxide dehydrogenase [Celeribacter indicus]SDW81371.1 carbon-monoxide dehydrogenase large subunit [Celeribacter indicus]